MTLLDGIVLARSVFEHSINYRSVVVLGTATPVTDPDEKNAVLEAFTEKLLPGRFADARPPTRKELKATGVLSLPLDEASAKVRDGGPDDGDYPGRRARRLGGAHPARRPALSRRCRRPTSGRASRCRRTRSATGGPASPAEPAPPEEVPEHDRERHQLEADPEDEEVAEAAGVERPSSRGSARRSRSGT